MRLLERDSQLSSLIQYAEDARCGDGRLVLLAGEAGVGKTSLLEKPEDELSAALATHQMRRAIADVGVPDIPTMIQQVLDSGGHLWACQMSAEMQHLALDDLYDEVEAVISAADFIEKTAGAQLLFI